MQADWLTATAYQSTERLITLINDFLLGLKIKKRGVTKSQVIDRMNEARIQLDTAFAQIETISAANRVNSVPGLSNANLAICSLNRPLALPGNASVLADGQSVSHLRLLLCSDTAESTDELIEKLSAIRAAIERTMAPDVRQMMGTM